MGKRVIAINSSKRKKNTYGILKELKEKFKEQDIDLDILNLFEYNITPCVGCESCVRFDKCGLKDDTEKLMEIFKAYDGVILSSPVYMGNVSGMMKLFIDRTAKWFHRPELVGKPTMYVVTTAASGIKDTTKYLKGVSIQWGLMPTSSITRTVNTIKKDIREEEYIDFINHLKRHRDNYKPSLNQLIMYQVQKVLAIKIHEIDRVFWTERGWNNSIYYYGNISFYKKSIAKIFYNMLYKKVKKVEN